VQVSRPLSCPASHVDSVSIGSARRNWLHVAPADAASPRWTALASDPSVVAGQPGQTPLRPGQCFRPTPMPPKG